MLYATPPLRLARLRFELRARTSLHLPLERRGEKIYGALGTNLRRALCEPQCKDPVSCRRREDCVFARLFDPQSPAGAPFGSEAVKGFFIRPLIDSRDRRLRDQSDGSGGSVISDPEFDVRRPLRFELRLVGKAIEAATLFVEAFRQLETTGFEDRAIDASSVLSLDWSGTEARLLLDEGRHTGASPIVLDLDRMMNDGLVSHRVRIRFETPTQIKHRRSIERVPTLGGLVARVRDRISQLCLQWQEAEWLADYGAIERLACSSSSTCEEGGWCAHERTSTRTRRTIPVAGFCGTVVYDSVHPSLGSLLRIGEEIQVGRNTSWGNGRYTILAP